MSYWVFQWNTLGKPELALGLTVLYQLHYMSMNYWAFATVIFPIGLSQKRASITLTNIKRN